MALALAGLLGCAKILGLEERTAERDAGAGPAVVDAARVDEASCTSNARACVGLLQARVCSSAGEWTDERLCTAGLEECASETGTCVRCAAKAADVGAWRVVLPVVAPSARALAMTAYDTTRRQIVLFGGHTFADAVVSDTYLWDGSTWTGALPVTSPSRRYAAAMADDAARGELVLFGGEDGRIAIPSDTWVWNGTSWTQRCGPGQERCGPSPRMVHAMAYDADRKRVVMFGGGRIRVAPALAYVGPALSDTWEWDGATWRETCGETSAPCAIPGLRGASMVYDPVRRRVVLYGGEGDRVGDDPNLVDRVWEYDGATWSRRDEITSVPPARAFASMTYDDARARIVLHGGVRALGGSSLSDTWEYDGNCWKDVTSATALPPANELFASSYDAARAELLVFGGYPARLPGDTTDTTALRRSPRVGVDAGAREASNTWTTLAPMKSGRAYLASAAVNGKGYVVGGTSSSTIEVYEPLSDAWVSGSSPEPPVWGASTAVLGSKVYLFGGTNRNPDGDCCPTASSSEVDVYDTSGKQWSRVAPGMPRSRTFTTAVVLAGKAFVIGGFSSTGFSADVAIYDPNTSAWTMGAAMPTARDQLSSCVASGAAYAMGGRVSDWTPTSVVEKYDPVTDAWTARAPMPTARYGATCAEVNGILYVIGGHTKLGHRVSKVEAYDPVTDTWSRKADMPTPRAELTSFTIDGRIFVAGGLFGKNLLDRFEVYTP